MEKVTPKQTKTISLVIKRLKDLIRCTICDKPIEDVHRTTCGHYFCGSCISRVLEEKPKGRRSAACPRCEKNIVKRSVNLEATFDAVVVELKNLFDALKGYGSIALDTTSVAESPSESGSGSSSGSESGSGSGSGSGSASEPQESVRPEVSAEAPPVSKRRLRTRAVQPLKLSESSSDDLDKRQTKKPRLGKKLEPSHTQGTSKPQVLQRKLDTSTPHSLSRQPLAALNVSPISLPENGRASSERIDPLPIEGTPRQFVNSLEDGREQAASGNIFSLLAMAALNTGSNQLEYREMYCQTEPNQLEVTTKFSQTEPEKDLFSRLTSLVHLLCTYNGVQGFLNFEGFGRIDIQLSKPKNLVLETKGVGTSPSDCPQAEPEIIIRPTVGPEIAVLKEVPEGRQPAIGQRKLTISKGFIANLINLQQKGGHELTSQHVTSIGSNDDKDGRGADDRRLRSASSQTSFEASQTQAYSVRPSAVSQSYLQEVLVSATESLDLKALVQEQLDQSSSRRTVDETDSIEG